MTGTLLPFRRRSLAPGKPAPGKAVSIVIGDTELWLEPAQARELGRDLLELADDADGSTA